MKKMPVRRLGIVLFATLFALVFMFRPVSAAISFRDVASADTASGSTSLDIPKPSGVVANDILIAHIGSRGGSATTVTPPSGWTLINTQDNGTVQKSSTYYKVATGTEGSSYAFTLSPSRKAAGIISAYSGVDTTAPINAEGVQVNTSGTTMTSPDVLTTANDAWVIASFSINVTTTLTAGSGMTLRAQDASTGLISVGLQDTVQTTAGQTGTKTMTAAAAAGNMGHTIALKPAPTLTISQVGYRFFNNSTTSGQVGTVMAAQDTLATAPSVGQPFRLRLLLGATGGSISSGTAFKLQYKAITSGSCNATGTFTDVTTATPIRFYDNTGTADGYTPLVASGNDPVRSGVTRVNQSYEEANNFSVSTTIGTGQDGMWDFALTLGDNADIVSTYCLRAATNAGVALDTYGQVPAVQPLVFANKLASHDYRWYQNADSTTPGSVLTSTNTAAALSTPGSNMRLRTGLNGIGYIKEITAGYSHTCAIASDDKAYCWGDDTYGQLGDDSTLANQETAVAVNTSGALSGKTILQISAGSSHTCAIASDNKAYCWGRDNYGQLGDNTALSDKAIPSAVHEESGVLLGKTILSISAGLEHTCAIASDNKAYCWGRDNYGQLGDNTALSDKAIPSAVYEAGGVLVGKTILSISAGGNHTCAIASDNKAYCWGSDSNGQLGNGLAGDEYIPASVSATYPSTLTGKTVLSISAGNTHTCAIASGDTAHCWGNDSQGQLGNDATMANQSVPVAVDTSGVLSGKTVRALTTSLGNTYAIASDNNLYAWGWDVYGQLGDDTNHTDKSTPVSVYTSGALLGKTMQRVAGGVGYACAISSDNDSYCWGDDSQGQLGNGPGTAGGALPIAMDQSTLPKIPLKNTQLSLSLQFAQKSAASCSLQTGYADVTASTVIAYNDNPTPANAAVITSNANDPISSALTTPQTYHDAQGSITNPTTIAADKYGLWDFSLKDNGAPGSTTYCLRLAGSDGTALGSYSYYPEITTAAAGLTLNQMTRGGGGVSGGTKSRLTW